MKLNQINYYIVYFVLIYIFFIQAVQLYSKWNHDIEILKRKENHDKVDKNNVKSPIKETKKDKEEILNKQEKPLNNTSSKSRNYVLDLKATTGLPLNVCGQIWKESGQDWEGALKLVKEKYESLKLKPISSDIKWYHTLTDGKDGQVILSIGLDQDSILRNSHFQTNLFEVVKGDLNIDEELSNLMKTNRQSFAYSIKNLESGVTYSSYQNDKIGNFSSVMLVIKGQGELISSFGKDVFSFIVMNDLSFDTGFKKNDFINIRSMFDNGELNKTKYKDYMPNALIFTSENENNWEFKD